MGTERLVRLVTVLHLLGLYVARVVVSRGILGSRAVRRALVACAAVTVALMSVIAYLFLRRSAGDEGVASLVLELSTGSSLFWALVAVLVVRVLVVGSPEMMEVTSLLPVTSRERQHAVSILEVLLAVAISTAGLLPFTAGSLLAYGPSVLDEALACVALPCVAALLLLSVSCRLADLLMGAAGLGGVRGNLVVLALALGAVWSWQQLPGFLARVSSGAEPFTLWPLAFHDVLNQYGLPALLLVAIALALVWGALLVLLPAAPVSPRSRYYALRVPDLWAPPVSPLVYHVYQVARSRFTADNVLLAVQVAAVILVMRSPVSIVWALEPVVMGGFFHYASVIAGVAVLQPRQGAFRLYLHMLGAQLVVMAPLIAGGLVLDRMTGAGLLSSLAACGGVLVSATVAVSVGAIMPAHDDNPVSIVLGTSVIVVVLVLAALMVGIVNLPAPVNVSAGAAGWAAIVALGVAGAEYNRRMEGP